MLLIVYGNQLLTLCYNGIGYTACYMRRTATSNSDGGQLVGRRTEIACREQCVALYPHCVAVDYRLSDGYCYTQKTTTGGQWNECCTRYEIFCGGPSGQMLTMLPSFLTLLLTIYAPAAYKIRQNEIQYTRDKKLCCCREAARYFVSVSS